MEAGKICGFSGLTFSQTEEKRNGLL